MPAPRVLILRAPGTNCDQETAFAFEQAGGRSSVEHIHRLRDDPRRLRDFQIFCIPGGFSYGDDVAAGRILALELNRVLGELLREFIEADKLLLGICNGFQTLLKAGMLTRDVEPHDVPAATLTWNDHGRYEDRWVGLRTSSDHCVFLRGIASLELPIAHAEGKFVARDEALLSQWSDAGRLALRYARRDLTGGADAERSSECGAQGESTGDDILPFPQNPNGSQADVAGLCDATGRVLGLMPHPERYIFAEQHPRWTRGDDCAERRGKRIFENAVRYF